MSQTYHKVILFTAIMIWMVAILVIQIVPHQSDFPILLIGFPLAIISYLYIIFNKTQSDYLLWLIGFGLLVRLISVFYFPRLSDDIFRFIWDGRLTHFGIIPYAHLPVDIVQQLPALDAGGLLSKMNSPSYYTVYPPVGQLIFYLSSGLGLSIHMSSIIMKSLFCIAEIVTLVFGLKTLKQLQLSPWAILIYWLNPLIIIEGVGNLHFEIIMIAFLSVAMYCWYREKYQTTMIFLALSVGSKLLSLLVLPFLLWQRRWAKGIKLLLLFTIVSVLIFSPLLFGLNFSEFLSSIDLYFRKFEFNGSIYYLLRWLGIQFSGYNLIAYIGPILGLGFIAAAIVFTIKSKWKDPFSYLFFIVLLYLLLATTVHPWYLSIPLFCSVFVRSRVAIVWSCLIWMTYINYSYVDYYENLYIVALEYLALATYAIWEWKLHNKLEQPKA